MKKIVSALLLIVVFSQGYSQTDFKTKFEKARHYMEEFQYEKAAPIFAKLYKNDSTNMNLAYLLGVCYTMGPVFDNHAIHLFEKAKLSMNEEYDSKSELERTTPIHVFYYLAVAYAQSFNFPESKKANDRFRELIGTINGKYLRDAEPLIKGMEDLKSLLNEPPASSESSFGWDENEGDPPTGGNEGNGEFIDGGGEPADGEGFYGIQIGAFFQTIPTYLFSGTENVKAYRGKNGMVRFVVGSVATRAEAEAIRDNLRASGYSDAFLVRLNRADFKEEIR